MNDRLSAEAYRGSLRWTEKPRQENARFTPSPVGLTITGTWIPGTDSYRIDGDQIEALRREGFEFKAAPDTTEAYLVAPVGYHGNCLSFAKESEALDAARILAAWLAKPVRVVGRRNGAQGEIARFTPLPDRA